MTSDEKRLLRQFRSLREQARVSLLDYADFLATRSPDPEVPAERRTPLDIPRPQEESVVKAIRRLMATYPMLDRDKLLHDTSGLMTRHVVHKDPAAGVIDELEQLFRRHYQTYLQQQDD